MGCAKVFSPLSEYFCGATFDFSYSCICKQQFSDMLCLCYV